CGTRSGGAIVISYICGYRREVRNGKAHERAATWFHANCRRDRGAALLAPNVVIRSALAAVKLAVSVARSAAAAARDGVLPDTRRMASRQLSESKRRTVQCGYSSALAASPRPPKRRDGDRISWP